MDEWSTHWIDNESIDVYITEYEDNNDNECLIEALPVEILVHILEYLDLVHVYRVAQTKNLFNNLCESKLVWISLFKQRFNSVRDMNFLETNEDPIDYKDVLLSYEHCLRDVNELIEKISSTLPASAYFTYVEALVQKYPGVAVRILIDLEVHHILFSSISEDFHTFFKFTELLVSDDRNKIIIESYGLMRYLEIYLRESLDISTRKRVINTMLDLPLRHLNDHHGVQCNICEVTPIKRSLLYASESSNFTKKFCGKCYFKAPKEEYLVLRSNNFMKHPTAGIRQSTNNPITKVHYTSCSNCEGYPIYGAVYRCVICSQYKPNFDLCAHCRALHPDNHTFLELRKVRENYFSAKRSELLQSGLISTDADYNFNEENMSDWMMPPIEFEYTPNATDWIGFYVTVSRLIELTATVSSETNEIALKFPDFTICERLTDVAWISHDGIRGCVTGPNEEPYCFHIWPTSARQS